MLDDAAQDSRQVRCKHHGLADARPTMGAADPPSPLAERHLEPELVPDTGGMPQSGAIDTHEVRKARGTVDEISQERTARLGERFHDKAERHGGAGLPGCPPLIRRDELGPDDPTTGCLDQDAIDQEERITMRV